MKATKIFIKGIITGVISITLFVNGCSENYLDVYPEDRITSVIFWQDESDVKLALNSIYKGLAEDRTFFVYSYGPGLDAMTPNAHQWTWWEGEHQFVGNGSLRTDNRFARGRWQGCYKIIYRANYFLENIDKANLTDEVRAIYVGEAHFLRGVAYALLADNFGGVPIITSVIDAEEANSLERASVEETWNQVISDYDVAIAKLNEDAPEIGRATKGAALGMKMRAYLYQNKYDKVLEVVNQIDVLGKYSLFPSYEGLFDLENENNQEVIFDIQFMDGERYQGQCFDGLFGPAFPTMGSNSVAPIQDLVDAYETVDGSPVDPLNPYSNRDPRLEFTILRPGAYFGDLLFPEEIQIHVGQRVGFGMRKYTLENMTDQIISCDSPLNFIVLRYADVLLSKAEALIEENQNIDEAIALINRIRTERDDVKISALPTGLSQSEARVKLRHERRIEFALEGIYWEDIRRWNIGSEIYPVEVRAPDGGLIDTKFPMGYDEHFNLLPIPDYERSINPNLDQNQGY